MIASFPFGRLPLVVESIIMPTTTRTTTRTTTTTTTVSHYKILGVSSTATLPEIKTAFYALARNHHPDKRQQLQQHMQLQQRKEDNDDNVENYGDDIHTSDETSFARLQQAWEVLRDHEMRHEYDQQRLQHKLQERSRVDGAISIYKDNDLQQAYDDETDETFYIYTCRCGEEIVIIDDQNEAHKKELATQQTQQQRQGPSMLVDCPGCCFVYKLEEAKNEEKKSGGEGKDVDSGSNSNATR